MMRNIFNFPTLGFSAYPPPQAPLFHTEAFRIGCSPYPLGKSRIQVTPSFFMKVLKIILLQVFLEWHFCPEISKVLLKIVTISASKYIIILVEKSYSIFYMRNIQDIN